MTESPWLAWQVVDSAFPTGAFAHSWGLEAAWQQGAVADAAALRRFVDTTIRQSACGVLPLVNAAYQRPETLAALDALADAFLTSTIANRASRVQGRTLIATAVRIWPRPGLQALHEGSAAGASHVAPLTGATFRLVGLPLPVVQEVVLFAAARGVLSAAVRLGIAGSYEAQRLQYECAASLDAGLAWARHADVDDLTQTAPLIDLLQAGHDRLYSRLFQS